MSEAAKGQDVDSLVGLCEAWFRAMRAGSLRVWLDLQLSVPQLKVLHILATAGPHSPSALADVLRVSPATVTGLCDGLVERGLALRESHPDDRRSNRVVATQEGQRLIADLSATHRMKLVRLFEVLSEEDRGAVAGALQTLLRAAQQID